MHKDEKSELKQPNDLLGMLVGLGIMLGFVLAVFAVCAACSGCTLTISADGSRQWRVDGVQAVRAVATWQEINATK